MLQGYVKNGRGFLTCQADKPERLLGVGSTLGRHGQVRQQFGQREDAPCGLAGAGHQVGVAGDQSVGAARACQMQDGQVVRVTARGGTLHWAQKPA